MRPSFGESLFALKTQAEQDLSINDYVHLRKIIWVNRILLLLGFGTAWIIPNPFSMICISIALHGQWCIVAHHVLHKGYDKVPGVPARYQSGQFASGWRRFTDWLDWIYPPAWKYEHNTLHHFYTNENLDPDFVVARIKNYIKPSWPVWLRALAMGLNICAWKASYYSKNTFKAYREKKNYNHQTGPAAYAKFAYLYGYLPYIGMQLILVPLLFFPLGWHAVLFVFISRLGAEILTNIHTFLTIVPNHCGDDLPFQPNHFSGREEFYLHQIASTCNYHTGGFWRDYLQGYLNYQIEHHLFPDLPPSQYVKLQPKVKALCARYGIKYRQESIMVRIKKTFHILLLFTPTQNKL